MSKNMFNVPHHYRAEWKAVQEKPGWLLTFYLIV